MKKLFIILLGSVVFMQIKACEVNSFNDGWSFMFGDAKTLSAATGMLSGHGARPVTIPHTWNAHDYLTGGEFKRCPGIFTRSFELPSGKHSDNCVWTVK